MSILGRHSSCYAEWEPDTLLTHCVTGREAAQILGVSAGRWRQIVGAREKPGWPGEGFNTAGERGARWQMRAVLTYALVNGRSISTPLPRLLPFPKAVDPQVDPRGCGRARYESIKGRVWNAPAAAEVRLEPAAASDSLVSAWAEMFAPVEYYLCGQEQSALLLLTGLWPTTSAGVTVDLVHLVRKALAVPGWSEVLGQMPALTVVVVPVSNRESFTAPSSVAAYDFRPDLLEPLLQDSAEMSMGKDRWLAARFGKPQEYRAAAIDVAACLGWSALPWWRWGTTSRATVSRWRPGNPVAITVPPAAAGQHQATKWLLSRDGCGQANREDLAALASLVAPAHFGQTYRGEESLPAGLQDAADVVLPEAPQAPGGSASADRALNAIYEDPALPTVISRELLGYIGDPAFVGAAHLRFDTLSGLGEWEDLFRRLFAGAGIEETPENARWRALEEARQAASEVAAMDVRKIRLGPLGAPALVDEESITWLAPTGFQPESNQDLPHLALPSEDQAPLEVLLVAESDGAQTRGWVRTLDGALVPLPGKSQWLTSNHGAATVMHAAFAGVTASRAWDERRKAMLAPLEDGDQVGVTELERLLTEAGAQPHLTLPWEDFESVARLVPWLLD